jgi:hypothetical protein
VLNPIKAVVWTDSPGRSPEPPEQRRGRDYPNGALALGAEDVGIRSSGPPLA